MNKNKILFIDTVHPLLQDKLEQQKWECIDGTQWNLSEIFSSLDQYTGIVIRSRFKIDKPFLDRATSLKFIARAGAGMENIDFIAAKNAGITCINAPEGNRNAVAEHALGMLLALLNNFIPSDREVRTGSWNREQNRGVELMNKIIAIIGFGNTGSTFAKKLSGMDATVLVYDPYVTVNTNVFGYVKQVEMNEIFENADIISFHIPLTKETDMLVDSLYLDQFSKPVYVINTSRGKIVSIQDLNTALQSGKVKGAALDVLEFESLSFENIPSNEIPESFKTLTGFSNVILSPHIAGWTYESHEKISAVLADKILMHFPDFNFPA